MIRCMNREVEMPKHSLTGLICVVRFAHKLFPLTIVVGNNEPVKTDEAQFARRWQYWRGRLVHENHVSELNDWEAVMENKQNQGDELMASGFSDWRKVGIIAIFTHKYEIVKN